jgi:cyclohexa-1,5-dienecarbonyl-CoA hydratase
VPGSVAAEERAGVLILSLQKPRLNILDIPLLEELSGAILALEERRDVRVLVLRSGIPGIFSAGVEVRDHVRERIPAMLSAVRAVVDAISSARQASIAEVDGACLGGALEVAASCDFLLASSRATFGLPEIGLGCFPFIASVLLPRTAGRAAAEMVLTGSPLSASRASAIGLVTRVSDPVSDDVRALAESLASKSGAALALARRALRYGAVGSRDEALDRVEALYAQDLARTEDAEEGIAAFLGKRPPRWRHR